MLKKVSWRSWAGPGLLFAIYFILGFFWFPKGSSVEWIFKVGTLGATFAPLALIGIYTATGNKWWANNIGTALVQLALSIPVITGPLAWSAWLDNGSITGGEVAWLEIAGPVLVTLAILRLCWVFYRYHKPPEGNGS